MKEEDYVKSSLVLLKFSYNISHSRMMVIIREMRRAPKVMATLIIRAGI